MSLASMPGQRTCCMSMGAVQQSTMRVVTWTLSAHSFSRCSAAWTAGAPVSVFVQFVSCVHRFGRACCVHDAIRR